MKNRLTILLLLAISLFSTSCINILEEITFNKDGSGTYALTFDLSGIMEMGMLGEILKMGGEEGSALGEKITGNLEKDSTVYFKDALPADIKAATGNAAFWDQVTLKLQASESKKKLNTTINLSFKNVDEIDFLFKNMSKISAAAGDQAGGLLPLPGEGLPGLSGFKWGKKSLARLPAGKTSGEKPANEDLDMIKMFLGSAKYTTVYHLPGRVRKASINNAKIDGNTVTVETPLLDMMEGKAKFDGNISYK